MRWPWVATINDILWGVADPLGRYSLWYYGQNGREASEVAPMRWPWVSRELYEDAVGNVDRFARLIDQDSVRYDALLDKYHALKMQGAVSVEPRQPVEAKEPDAVHWAIMQRAGNNRALSGYLLRLGTNPATGERCRR